MEFRLRSPTTGQKNVQTFSFDADPATNEPLFSSTPGHMTPSGGSSPRANMKNVSNLGSSPPRSLVPPKASELAHVHNVISSRVRMKFKKQRDMFWAFGGSRDGSLTYVELLSGLHDLGIEVTLEDIEDLLHPYSSNHDTGIILFPELSRFLTSDPDTVAHTPVSSVEEPLPTLRHIHRHENLSAGYEQGLEQVMQMSKSGVEDVTAVELDNETLAPLYPHMKALEETCRHYDRSEDGTVSILELREAIRFELGDKMPITDSLAAALLEQFPAHTSGRVDYITLIERISEINPGEIAQPDPPSLSAELLLHLYSKRTSLREATTLFERNPTWCLSTDELCDGLVDKGVNLHPEELKLLLNRHVCGANEERPVSVGEYKAMVSNIPVLAGEAGVPIAKRPRALNSMVVEKLLTHRHGAASHFVGVFRQMDQSGTGLLSFSDFGNAMSKWGVPLDDGDLRTLLSPYDHNNDDKLTYQEFVEMANQPIPEGEDEFDDEHVDVVEAEPLVDDTADDSFVDAIANKIDKTLLYESLGTLDRHGNGRLSRQDATTAISMAIKGNLDDGEATSLMNCLDRDNTGIILCDDIVACLVPVHVDDEAERAAYVEWLRTEIRTRLGVRMGGSNQRKAYQFMDDCGRAASVTKRFGRSLCFSDIVAGAKKLDLDITEETAKEVMKPFIGEEEAVSMSAWFKFLAQ